MIDCWWIFRRAAHHAHRVHRSARHFRHTHPIGHWALVCTVAAGVGWAIPQVVPSWPALPDVPANGDEGWAASGGESGDVEAYLPSAIGAGGVETFQMPSSQGVFPPGELPLNTPGALPEQPPVMQHPMMPPSEIPEPIALELFAVGAALGAGIVIGRRS